MSVLPNDPKELVKLYIANNLSVFPVRGDKKPLVPSWKEYQTKRLTTEEFGELVRKYKRPGNEFKGIGLVTGEISGITVVDFDNGSEDIFKDIETPTVKTGSGGKHYYFKYTKELQQGANPTLKIDIRNDGGYAIMPPSVSDKGKYEWVKEIFNTPLAEVPKSFIESYKKSTPKVKYNFQGVSEGGRNQQAVVNAGKLIAKFRDDIDTAYTLFLAWNTTNTPPLDNDEINRVFDWCYSKDKSNSPTQPLDLSTLSEEDFFNIKQREMLSTGLECIDKDFKFPSGFYVICANPGVGKGWFALWLTRKFYERHNKRSVYFSLEMPEPLIRQRIIQAWSDLTERQVNKYLEDKNFSPMANAKKMVNDKAIFIDEFGGSDTSAVKPENFKKLFLKYYEQGFRIFHFDHLHELDGANVNDKNQQVTETWSKMFQGLAKDYADVWLFVYAQPNGSASSKKIIKREDVAGSKSITQKCEFFLSLNREVVIDEKTGLVDVKNDTRDVFIFLGKNRITSVSGVVFPAYFSFTGNFTDISKKQYQGLGML